MSLIVKRADDILLVLVEAKIPPDAITMLALVLLAQMLRSEMHSQAPTAPASESIN